MSMASIETPRKKAYFIDSDNDGEIPKIDLTLRIQPHMNELIVSSLIVQSPESELELETGQAEEA